MNIDQLTYIVHICNILAGAALVYKISQNSFVWNMTITYFYPLIIIYLFGIIFSSGNVLEPVISFINKHIIKNDTNYKYSLYAMIGIFVAIICAILIGDWK